MKGVFGIPDTDLPQLGALFYLRIYEVYIFRNHQQLYALLSFHMCARRPGDNCVAFCVVNFRKPRINPCLAYIAFKQSFKGYNLRSRKKSERCWGVGDHPAVELTDHRTASKCSFYQQLSQNRNESIVVLRKR